MPRATISSPPRNRAPQLKIQGLIGYDGPDMTLVNAEYTLNDFVYGTLSYLDELGDDQLPGRLPLGGSGVFASLDYTDISGANGYIVSGGYRFDLGGGSYAALSLEYGGGDVYDGSFAGQAIVKYYADGLKVSGQLYVDDDGNYMIHGKANVAAGDRLVWGGGLTWYDSDDYPVFAGLTWTGEKSLFDGIVNVDDAGNTIYYLSYLYSISDALAVGLNYMDGDMAPRLGRAQGRVSTGRRRVDLLLHHLGGRRRWRLSSASATRRASRRDLNEGTHPLCPPLFRGREGLDTRIGVSFGLGFAVRPDFSTTSETQRAWQRGRPSFALGSASFISLSFRRLPRLSRTSSPPAPALPACTPDPSFPGWP